MNLCINMTSWYKICLIQEFGGQNSDDPQDHLGLVGVITPLLPMTKLRLQVLPSITTGSIWQRQTTSTCIRARGVHTPSLLEPLTEQWPRACVLPLTSPVAGGFESWHGHLPAVWPQASHLTSLSFIFSLQRGVATALTLGGLLSPCVSGTYSRVWP